MSMSEPLTGMQCAAAWAQWGELALLAAFLGGCAFSLVVVQALSAWLRPSVRVS